MDAKEIDYVALSPRLPGQAAHPPRPPVLPIENFTEFARKEGDTFTVIRERSQVGTHIRETVGNSPLDGRPAVVVYQAP
jgi:hypothetical protein